MILDKNREGERKEIRSERERKLEKEIVIHIRREGEKESKEF